MDTDTIGTIIYIVIILIILLSLIVFTFVIFKIIYIIIKKYIPSKYALIIVSFLPLFICYSFYRAIYPSDDFYLIEFKELIHEKNMDGIRVIYGSATYPTFHPDYCSAALLDVTEKKYNLIIKNIKNNSDFKVENPTGSEAYSDVIKETKFQDSKFIYKAAAYYIYPDFSGNNYYFIAFLPDNKIIFHKCFE